jgi:carboxymethylenebutenolidase
MDDVQDEVSLPSAKSVVLGPGITLQPPLSRLGKGPGIILLVPTTSSETILALDCLSPLQKWAEEGFAVVEIQPASVEASGSLDKSIRLASDALSRCLSCEWDKVGLIGK